MDRVNRCRTTGIGRNPKFNGRRQPSRGGTSRMMREYQVRICERLGVKFPGPTRQLHALPRRNSAIRFTPVSGRFARFRVVPTSCHRHPRHLIASNAASQRVGRSTCQVMCTMVKLTSDRLDASRDQHRLIVGAKSHGQKASAQTASLEQRS